MTDEELKQQSVKLKQIKPNKVWADLLLKNVMTQVAKKEVQSLASKPKVAPAQASYLFSHYRVALTAFGLLLIFGISFALAQNSLPGSALYSLKLFSQDVVVALAPNQTKSLVKLTAVEERVKDLAKTEDREEVVKKIAQSVRDDLQNLPVDVQKNKDKAVVLDISKKIQEKNEELQKVITESNLQPTIKEDLQNTLAETQDKILALITETTNIISSCPEYLTVNLEKISMYFQDSQVLAKWSTDEVTKVRILLGDIDKNLKAGNCLEAMEKIESINQLLQIHSLDTPD
ncbi:MAG: hypothetical protein KBI07_07985 [Candidatus Atribacteria bacterium]|nr:hypothetical protein [Candidatus Atribacteria bacterium]